jgi:predicted enzyme related to lactoylglutathione lyase
MISGLAGSTIFTEDSEKLAAFYKDIVGLPVAPSTGTDPTSGETFWVFGPPDSAVVCVGKHSEVHGKNNDPARHIVGLASNDIEADFARLKSAGVEFIEEPTPAGQGLRIATFKDPDGNYIQLLQFG